MDKRNLQFRNEIFLLLGWVGAVGCEEKYCPPPQEDCLYEFTKKSECPSAEKAKELLNNRIDEYYDSADPEEMHCISEVLTEAYVGSYDTICCYDVINNCFLGPSGGCCSFYGRPYRDGDAVSLPTVRIQKNPAPETSVSPAPRRLPELSTWHREHLVMWWLKNAQAEHSSVAGFTQFTLDLLAQGAPVSLIRKAQQCAMQELDHASDCFMLASLYGGCLFSAGSLPIKGSVAGAKDLAELAAETVRDGCIGETVAAWMAAGLLEEVTDPDVRPVLERIVRDEQEHALLAWATLNWAIGQGGESVRDAALLAFHQTLPDIEDFPEDPDLLSRGMPGSQRQLHLRNEVMRHIIQPAIARFAEG